MNFLPQEPLSNNLKISIIVLVIANLMSLIGIIFFGWNAILLLLAYWFESAIIGFFTLLKIALAKGNLIKNLSDSSQKINKIGTIVLKIFLIPFFIVHFGGFMFGHLIFITAFFLQAEWGTSFQKIGADLFSMGLLIIPLFISHGFSFFTNFLGKKEYEKITPNEAMFEPYPRIIVMHLAIIVGAFLSFALILLSKNPNAGFLNLGQAIMLVILKTTFDVFSHLKQHRKFETNNSVYNDLASRPSTTFSKLHQHS